MGKELAAATFDYSEVDGDTKGKLLSILRDVKREKARHETSGMELGKSIATAHALFAGDGGDGLFSRWVECECGFSRSSAYNYMNVWQRFQDCPSLGQFTQEALYALASPKTPEPAVKEAIKLAENGVRVNKQKTDELLGKFRELGDKAKSKANHPSKSTPEPTKPAGPCPHGGEHDYDDEACKNCHDPKPSVKQFKDGFEFGANSAGPVPADEGIDLAAKQAPYDAILNAITLIQKQWNAITEDERDGVYSVDKKNRVNALIRDLRTPIVQARPMAVCDHCKGEGCRKCQNCGWWPRSVVEGLKR